MRQNDLKDHWEDQSAEFCFNFLRSLEVDETRARELSNTILRTEPLSFMGKLLQSADSLDIMRVKNSFELNRLEIFPEIAATPAIQLDFCKIVRDIRDLIAYQHDLKRPCRITLHRRDLFTALDVTATRNAEHPELKQAYEQAENCFIKTAEDLKLFYYLHGYYTGDFVLAMKSIRADENCYIRPFVDTLTRIDKSNAKQPALRFGPKKPWTVNGTGFYKQSEKPHQYTPEEKWDFSKPQAASLVTKLSHPQVFGFDRYRRDKLAGVLVAEANVLYTNSLYIYDGGTVGRSKEFYQHNDAERYFQNKVNGRDPVLFADPEKFKLAIIKSTAEGKYNEALLRMRFKNDKVFIGSNTLEAKLIAINYARIIKNALRTQARNLNLDFDEAYEIPIVYYNPGAELHMRLYPKANQLRDKLIAQEIYRDLAQRYKLYAEKNYEILLALDEVTPEILFELLPDGESLIFKILADGYLHIARSLFDKCSPELLAELQAKTDWPKPPPAAALYHCARKGDLELLVWMLTLCAHEINTFTNGNTPLYIAAYNGHLEIVRALLAQPGIELNKDCSGATPLYIAALNGHLEVVRALLAQPGTAVNKACTGATPLYAAARNGQLEIVQALLAQPGIAVNDAYLDGSSPIYAAACNGHLEIVQALLARAEICFNSADRFGIGPLYLAAQNGHLEIVQALLAQPGITVNKKISDGSTPLYIAACNGHLEIVQDLLSNPTVNLNDARNDGATPLFVAAYSGHVEIVRALLAKPGIEVNKPLTDGSTPLYIAACNGHSEIVHALLSKPDIEVNKGHNSGVSPLFVAACNGQLEMVRALLNNPAIEVNKPYFDGATPLFAAAYNGHVEIVRALLAQPGIEVNREYNGASPLHAAAEKGNFEICNLLLKANSKELLFGFLETWRTTMCDLPNTKIRQNIDSLLGEITGENHYEILCQAVAGLKYQIEIENKQQKFRLFDSKLEHACINILSTLPKELVKIVAAKELEVSRDQSLTPNLAL